jgi:hypothetical protein
MSSINKHLNRWIKASFIQALRPLCEQGAYLFVEGEDRGTDAQMSKRIEVRLDGPYTRPAGSRIEWCSFVEVNLLCNISRDEGNIYARDNIKGLMAEMLSRDFCIYKVGNVGREPADDESLVGVMQLLPVDAIKVSDFGLIDSNTEVYQAVAEAHYEMYFTA